MGKTKHHTAAHDDETWMGFFRRWHEGEDSRALSAEAKVCPGTFHLHAARLGMRLKDLPEGHPAKRRSLPYRDRPDGWREPNGLLAEGQWRALFALRAQGVPDTVLGPQFGVGTTVICTQARRRGLRRADLRAAAAAAIAGGDAPLPPPSPSPGGLVVEPSPASPPPVPMGEDAPVEALGVKIAPGDWQATSENFDRAIADAAARNDLARAVALCDAKLRVEKAMFGPERALLLHPPSPRGLRRVPPPRRGRT